MLVCAAREFVLRQERGIQASWGEQAARGARGSLREKGVGKTDASNRDLCVLRLHSEKVHAVWACTCLVLIPATILRAHFYVLRVAARL